MERIFVPRRAVETCKDHDGPVRSQASSRSGLAVEQSKIRTMTKKNAHIVTEVVDFVEALYSRSTIHYALNHTQMESWIAIEGLEHFASRGWSCCETLGFITNAPVRPREDSELGIKFPDLVTAKGGVTLWWEFKAISTFLLHPKTAGGTFVGDMMALAGFDPKAMGTYIEDGSYQKARKNNDKRWIAASGLQKHCLAKSKNIGVALMFAPTGEREVPGRPGEGWSPAETLDRLAKAIEDKLGTKAEPIPSSTAPSACKPSSSAAGSRGSPASPGLPCWRGWLVEMPETPAKP
jgi:hypothetical protein